MYHEETSVPNRYSAWHFRTLIADTDVATGPFQSIEGPFKSITFHCTFFISNWKKRYDTIRGGVKSHISFNNGYHIAVGYPPPGIYFALKQSKNSHEVVDATSPASNDGSPGNPPAVELFQGDFRIRPVLVPGVPYDPTLVKFGQPVKISQRIHIADEKVRFNTQGYCRVQSRIGRNNTPPIPLPDGYTLPGRFTAGNDKPFLFIRFRHSLMVPHFSR